jgi:bifunctional DNA-binding transcriptional regulator/antitoxin component of YhaV-PrlF toxin-antitoxin module
MSIETAKMSERGQIIIPKEIRDEIGADVDTLFVVSTIARDTIVMRKLDTKLLVEEFKRLRSMAKKRSPRWIEAEIDASRKQ